MGDFSHTASAMADHADPAAIYYAQDHEHNSIHLADAASQTGTQSLPPPELPRLVAEQHVPLSASDKDSQRLIVVLSNASLETYRAAHGGRTGGREDKFCLLNSDEHIGVMRKMNRDISDARPDITHQVCLAVDANSQNFAWLILDPA